ncbi:hypothetical protein [Natrinema caseinilyticum]|uniref:hypothetical protein n=1 Tax=Natrinema caseinilyticum TaxID=2961570 RepID=UPI0020C35CD9|nr:hypothetical protein [Natrinema caseinilyticum]
MTTRSRDRARIRLIEIRDQVRTADRALPDPLTLEPSIRNISETIEAADRIAGDGASTAAVDDR